MKTYTPEFRIFRSTRSRRLFAVHQVDSKENSIALIKDSMAFDEAQETMLQLLEIKEVVAVNNTVQSQP